MIDPTTIYNSVQDFEVAGKKVLVRVDFNVPLEEGQVAGDERIKRALPTIRHLIEEEARVVLMSHLGRPGGEVVEELRMDPVATRLSEHLGHPVLKLDDCVGEEVQDQLKGLEDGEVALLENTRFHPGEKENDDQFAKELSKAGELYVNDAFGTAHRKHASTYGVAQHLPSAAGFLILDEIRGLSPARETPDHPFVAIIGGKKASSKIGALWDMLDRVDTFLIGGALAFTFLNAKGHMVGHSVVEESMVDEVREFLEKVSKERSAQVMLPRDAKVAEEFSAEGQIKTARAERIPAGWMGLDIGPATIEEYQAQITEAQTLVWAGPLGAFELEPFRTGTKEVAETVAEGSGYRVIGGGETGAAIGELGLEEEMDHVSTGGGACLAFLRGEDLPPLEILKK